MVIGIMSDWVRIFVYDYLIISFIFFYNKVIVVWMYWIKWKKLISIYFVLGNIEDYKNNLRCIIVFKEIRCY